MLSSRWSASAAALVLLASGAAATPGSLAAQPDPAAAVATSPRQVTSLDRGWRFSMDKQEVDPVANGFDDRAWRPVDLPHTWNWIGAYGQERDPRTNLTQGVGWYRLRFTAPAQTAGAAFLQFDGVGAIADVWLNGRKLGRHAGAFSTFRFDVTDAMGPGVNLLTVRVDNSKREKGSATGEVLPLAGDFFIYGGIYRGVSLITTADAHLDLMDYGGPGLYAATRSIEPAGALVSVSARVQSSPGRRALRLATMLIDGAGRRVAEQTTPITATPTSDIKVVSTTLRVTSPHLWDGRASPYLYRLRAELFDGDTLIDAVEEPFGIRQFHIDAEKGFFLNGRHLPLHGVSRHQDRFDKGWAISQADEQQDLSLIEEIGANTIRGAHYQHAANWYDLADRTGMVMWAEMPYVGLASWDKGPAPQGVRDNARTQLLELIRQNYNRPSIVTWSVGNEIDISAVGPNGSQHSLALLRELAQIAKQEDAARPTTFADWWTPDLSEKRGTTELVGATDLVGYNRYYGWYSREVDDLGPALDALHAQHPDTPMSLSEYGGGGAISQHTDDPRGGRPDPHGRVQPEEYQAWLIEHAWRDIARRPYLWASWTWAMFDFASPRAEGDSSDINTKGLITSDRKTRKDAFYFLKAAWSREPVVHVVGRRYTDRAYSTTDVKVYSNASHARLRINGVDLGSRACADHICTWPRVPLRGGANRIEAEAGFPGGAQRDAVEWRSPSPSEGLAINVGSLLGWSGPGQRRFGSDAFFESGQIVTFAAREGQDALAANGRAGSFTYRLPVPDARWALRLTFRGEEERPAGPPMLRLYGKPVEVHRLAASQDGSTTYEVTVSSRGGSLDLALQHVAHENALTALQLLPR